MKYIDIKINRFGGQNLSHRQFSLSKSELDDSLSLLPIENDWKKEK
jgi:hypothetical protein